MLHLEMSFHLFMLTLLFCLILPEILCMSQFEDVPLTIPQTEHLKFGRDKREHKEMNLQQSTLTENQSFIPSDYQHPLFPSDLFTQEERQFGAVVLHLFGVVYMFVALALVSDKFFVPSLNVIIEKSNIPAEVAGATFMAVGGSVVKLFTSFIGVFVSLDDVGIGSVVGSAVFKILFVISTCAFFSKKILSLKKWPLFRDFTFYSISLVVLAISFIDNLIVWWEAAVLLGLYVFYVFFVVRWDEQVKRFLDRFSRNVSNEEANSNARSEMIPVEVVDPIIVNETVRASAVVSEDVHHRQDQVNEKPLDLSWPEGTRKQLTYLFLIPILVSLWLTLPDTRKPKGKRFFVITFIGSILWIAGYSYLMVWWASLIGETVHIPPEVMGLTFLAVGTSLPNLITSAIVARKGFGVMAVSSSLGSNIFDIGVGLPLPWLLYCVIMGSPVPVRSLGMACSLIVLFGVLFFVVLTIACARWKLKKVLGITMSLFYFVFVAASLGFEYRIIHCPV